MTIGKLCQDIEGDASEFKISEHTFDRTSRSRNFEADNDSCKPESVKSSKWKNKSIKQFSVKYCQFPENGRIKTQKTDCNYHRIE